MNIRNIKKLGCLFVFILTCNLFSQTFSDGFESGGFVEGGWITTGDVFINNTQVNSGKYSAKGSGIFSLMKNFSSRNIDKLDISFSLNFEKIDGAFFISLLNSSLNSTPIISLYMSQGKFVARNLSNATIIYDNCSPSLWYRLRIVDDVINRKFDVYINDKLCASQYNLSTLSNRLDKFSFATAQNFGSVYIDDITYITTMGPVSFTDGFENGIISGWAFNGDVSVTDKLSHTGKYSLMLKNSLMCTQDVTNVIKDKVDLILWAKFDQSSKNIAIDLGNIGSNFIIRIYIQNNKGFQAIDGPSLKTFQYSFDINTWHKFRIVSDITSKKYDIYINDVLQASQLSYFLSDPIVFLNFYSTESSGSTFYFDDLSINSSTVNIGELNVIPNNYSLSQNYPNPFNPTTKIKFGLQCSSFTRLIVCDLLGREVKTLINSEMAAGYHEVDFNASDLSSGIYFYRIQANNITETKKMLLIK